MSGARHWERIEMCVGFWQGNLSERDFLEELELDGRIILNWIINKMGRRGLNLSVWSKGQWWTHVDTVIDPPGSIKCGFSLTVSLFVTLNTLARCRADHWTKCYMFGDRSCLIFLTISLYLTTGVVFTFQISAWFCLESALSVSSMGSDTLPDVHHVDLGGINWRSPCVGHCSTKYE
jgi:hypothetical protein